MLLYSVRVRESFPMKMIGTIIAGTGMAGSPGMAPGPVPGPVLGGRIFDTTGGCGVMYGACFGPGRAAFLTALTFRPFAKAAATVARMA